MKLSLAGIGFGLAAFCVAGAASAAEAGVEEPLFKKGRWVLDVVGADVPAGTSNGTYVGYVGPLTVQSDHSFGIGNSGYGYLTRTASAYGIEPSVDYFLTDHITIGGRVGVAWKDTHQYDSSTQYGPTHSHWYGLDTELAPRVGVAIPIIASLGFWPRLTVGAVSENIWSHGTGATWTTSEYVSGNFSLVARISPHILLELGPVLTYRTQSQTESGESFGSSPTNLDMVARSSFRLDF